MLVCAPISTNKLVGLFSTEIRLHACNRSIPCGKILMSCLLSTLSRVYVPSLTLCKHQIRVFPNEKPQSQVKLCEKQPHQSIGRNWSTHEHTRLAAINYLLDYRLPLSKCNRLWFVATTKAKCIISLSPPPPSR